MHTGMKIGLAFDSKNNSFLGKSNLLLHMIFLKIFMFNLILFSFISFSLLI